MPSPSAVGLLLEDLDAPLEKCYQSWLGTAAAPVEPVLTRYVIVQGTEEFARIEEVSFLESIEEPEALSSCMQEVIGEAPFAPLPEGGRITVVLPLPFGPQPEVDAEGPENAVP